MIDPNPTAAEIGALGGKARAESLTEEERKEMARNAVESRWRKAGKLKKDQSPEPPPKAPEPSEREAQEKEVGLYSLLKGTLDMGGVEAECHVLNNLKRVLTQREVVRVISGGRESGNLQRYLDRNPLTAKDFELGLNLQFLVPETHVTASGYEATVLVEICEKYLEARALGLLKKSQLALAAQAEIVIRACAKVGIIALIDEATGFQEIRAKNALRLKYQAFIAEDMQDWVKMFPDDFWYELARLEGIRYSPRNRPLRWGRYVMMFVYDAIDSDIGNWLRENNPNPRFLKNHHQWLKKFGREKVHDQIVGVVTVMKLCKTMQEFREKFAHVFKGAPLQQTFDDVGWELSENS
jgi:hypothetical protein